MRKLFYIPAALIALVACKNGHMAGDDPTRNDEPPGQGRPMDSDPSTRQRLNETTPDKQRPYADDKGTEQTTTAPPDQK